MSSHFYGWLNGSAKTIATKRGTKNSGISANLQDDTLSIRTQIWYNDVTKKNMISIRLGESSISSDYKEMKELYNGEFDYEKIIKALKGEKSKETKSEKLKPYKYWAKLWRSSIAMDLETTFKLCQENALNSK